ncbi:BTB/POZ domain-containing protein 3-like [Acanthopagrus latus]|uniref:BTB/POZ domain-containing protein 3-like n=1 Tax=Acanthopagrus latus TaxID=8177 RepID=UPI00187C6578|nr:BTB/POZ domain-containing protein 3-like [Acanthopagrus latus]
MIDSTQHLTNQQSDALTGSWMQVERFPQNKRRLMLHLKRTITFPLTDHRSNQWRYRGRCDSIQFAVDRRVFIAGFGLYGSSCDGSSSTFPVWFDYPVQIEPDTFYTASVVLDGNELSYFGQEGMTEVQCGKVTFQFQCSSDSTNGTGVQGGDLDFYSESVETSSQEAVLGGRDSWTCC